MNASNEDGPYFIPLRGGPDASRRSGAVKPVQPVSKTTRLTLSRVPKDRDGEWSADRIADLIGGIDEELEMADARRAGSKSEWKKSTNE